MYSIYSPFSLWLLLFYLLNIYFYKIEKNWHLVSSHTSTEKTVLAVQAGPKWQNIIIRAIIDRSISLIFEDTSAGLLEVHRSWLTSNNFLHKEMFSRWTFWEILLYFRDDCPESGVRNFTMMAKCSQDVNKKHWIRPIFAMIAECGCGRFSVQWQIAKCNSKFVPISSLIESLTGSHFTIKILLWLQLKNVFKDQKKERKK